MAVMKNLYRFLTVIFNLYSQEKKQESENELNDIVVKEVICQRER